MKVYNTLTRQKEEFIPLEPGKVKMYVCGPTVYNYIHIGNARSTVCFDTIRKYLEYRGYQVDYVSNFTDVDDKIIKAAQSEKITTKELADKYIAAFEEDTKKLNVAPACCHPRVIDHVDDIVAFVAALIERGYAYESAGDVYYRTRKFKAYGALSNQSLDELEVGASQRTGDEQLRKEDPLDFALWKSAKEGEIAWESPWGRGRPGWHIECSVMATKHLGETIDIHGGGQDLAFPHHENEIAQSEAKTGQPFANYWLHNAYLTVGENGEKMSKSLGNFVTAHELMKKIEPAVIRFALATTHYRRPMPFNQVILEDAQSNLARIRTAYKNASFRLDTAANFSTELTDPDLKALEADFIQEMDDDFHAANGITVVYQLVKWLNQYSEQTVLDQAVLAQAIGLLARFMLIFGVQLEEQTDQMLDQTIEKMIEERNQARKNKDFALSDTIRDQLKAQGIILEDTPQGTRWSRE